MKADSPLRAERDGQVLRLGEHAVAVAYDPDGEVWFVQASSVPGLEAEAGTLEELAAMLPAAIRETTLP